MELSARLNTIASMIPKGASIADIGTDHGFLPVWLAKNGVCSRIFACDLRAAPLKKAKDNAQKYGVSGRIEFLECDGLSEIEPESVDTIVIAGMGGETIAPILSKAQWVKNRRYRLLLQPMNDAELLREYLYENGFDIEREILIRDAGRLYTVMKARYTGQMAGFSPVDTFLSPTLKNSGDPLLPDYVNRLIQLIKTAEAGTAKSSKMQDVARNLKFQAALSGLNQYQSEITEMNKNADGK